MTNPGRMGVGAQARQAMTMRARVTRPQDVGRDSWGGDVVSSKPGILHDEVACYAWHPTDVNDVIDSNTDGVFGALRLVMPADAAVTERDTITEVCDRRDRIVFAGPLRVTAVVRRSGYLAVMARVQRSARSRA